MSPVPALKLAREFFICGCLSSVIILGLINAFIHLPHIYVVRWALRSPLIKSVAVSALQIGQISQLREYQAIVFQVTFACSILVFAVGEIVLTIGYWLGRENETDLEIGAADVDGWGREKLPCAQPTYS
ncbi:hypothetical protein B0H19DRAFT_239575 [Mycena capillaripes]|nr:hypothetical protein B0H19DRAFT_239575 [Mycena capillaripes]